jgi:hypothetical protein
VLFFSVMYHFVYVYFCVLCLILVQLPPGKPPFAVQLNNNNNNNNNNNFYDREACVTRKLKIYCL